MKKIKSIGIYLLLVMLIVSTVVGCTPETQEDQDIDVEDVENEEQEDVVVDYPIKTEDDFGNKETIEEEPMEIVSLAPHNTEILFALGLGDKVVGVTSFCDYPEEATTKEVIGGFSEANLEKIVELDPDLVLAYGEGDEEENNVLREAGIMVLGFMPETIDEVVEDMLTIGAITGSKREALEITDSMLKRKEEIVEKVKDEEKVKVFYEIWDEPLQAAGSGSFMGELLTLAGGENIAVDLDENGEDKIEEDYPVYDLEQLVERDPEVYLTSADSPEKTIESIKERPGYEDINAIKNNRIYIFEENEANIVSRPGPRIIDALELVTEAIHPELIE